MKVRVEKKYIPAKQKELRMAEVARIIAGALKRQQDKATNNPPKDKG